MSVVWTNARAHAEPAGCGLKLECTLQNDSPEPWLASDDFSLGWQLYDPESGSFISEGEWKRLEDLPSGERRDVGLRLELPPGSGRYHVYVSPRRRSRGWEYQRGSSFLLIDAEVEAGNLEVRGTRVASLPKLRWERLHRGIRMLPGTNKTVIMLPRFRAFPEPFIRLRKLEVQRCAINGLAGNSDKRCRQPANRLVELTCLT